MITILGLLPIISVGNKPGITKSLVWLKTKHNIMLLDTPGILWPKLDNKEIALNLAYQTLFLLYTHL